MHNVLLIVSCNCLKIYVRLEYKYVVTVSIHSPFELKPITIWRVMKIALSYLELLNGSRAAIVHVVDNVIYYETYITFL